MRTTLYLFAAIPAGFLPLAYLTLVGAVFAGAFLGFQSRALLEDGSLLWWMGELSIHATIIQWPVYVLWVLFSKGLTYRARLAWVGILVWLNMFAIPWFLYCKYVGRVWPPAGMTKKSRPTGLRWCQFSLGSCLVAIAFLGVFLVPVTHLVQTWQRLRIPTISARLASSGKVEWDGAMVPITALQPDLERSVRLIRADGSQCRFLIECFCDVREPDVMKLKAIGRDAGFDVVEITYLRWPSPDWSKTSD